jgi:hypothetical protein
MPFPAVSAETFLVQTRADLLHRSGHSQDRAHVQTSMPVHPHSRRLSKSQWKRQPSPRHVAMASAHARPFEPGQIHVQTPHSRLVLLDTRRCKPLPRLYSESAATAPDADRTQPQCHTDALGTQERCPEPSHRETRECSHITHKSQPKYQHNAVIPWPTDCARTDITTSQRAATQLRAHGIQSGCSSCA